MNALATATPANVAEDRTPPLPPGATRPRCCFYVDETMASPHGYIPCVLTEGEPHFAPLLGNGVASRPWYWGEDLSTARRICSEQNAALGLTPADVRDIELSCLAASFREQTAEDPAVRTRYDQARGRATARELDSEASA